MNDDKRKQAKGLLGTTGIRTFEMIQYVSGPLGGDINDWPANIQDDIYMALEVMAHKVQLPLTIVLSYCDKDIDSEDPQRTYFLRVIASEIVAADDRETRH